MISVSLCSLAAGNFHRKASVIMVDELLSAYPHQLSFSEAGLRIMITSHFPPKTRLSMASRMLINEVCLLSPPTSSSSEFAFSCSSVWVKMELLCFFWIPDSVFPDFILLTPTSTLAISPRGDFHRESFKSLCGYVTCNCCSQEVLPALIRH